MELAVRSDTYRFFEELLSYGIAYHDSMDFLMFGPAFKNDPGMAHSYASIFCPSLALELLRELHCRELIGVKICWASGLVRNYHPRALPLPCAPLLFSELADACLGDPTTRIHKEPSEKLEQAKEMHARARAFAKAFENPIPPEMLERIRAKAGLMVTN